VELDVGRGLVVLDVLGRGTGVAVARGRVLVGRAGELVVVGEGRRLVVGTDGAWVVERVTVGVT
jgi:hypothetical protein